MPLKRKRRLPVIAVEHHAWDSQHTAYLKITPIDTQAVLQPAAVFRSEEKCFHPRRKGVQSGGAHARILKDRPQALCIRKLQFTECVEKDLHRFHACAAQCGQRLCCFLRVKAGSGYSALHDQNTSLDCSYYGTVPAFLQAKSGRIQDTSAWYSLFRPFSCGASLFCAIPIPPTAGRQYRLCCKHRRSCQ